MTQKLPPFVKNDLIFMTVAGSNMYGTNTKDSDIDLRGVCVPPKNVVMGFARNFDQQQFEGEDTVVYSLMKFMKLCVENNPNIIELLFAPDDCIKTMHPTWERLLERRDEIISAKCYHTFTGYAHSQMSRMKGHREWLKSPPTHQPTRLEFGLKEAGSGIVKSLKGVDLAEVSPEALMVVEKEKRYKAATRRWTDYQRWIKERNPARAALERAHGYDCYSSDTQFLTEHGWKLFDSITEDERLATVYVGPDITNRPFGRIEYQSSIERYDGTFSGNMYQFVGHHTDVLVTPNHRMLIREVSRKKDETYDIVLEEAARLEDSFEFLRTITPKRSPHLPDFLHALPIKPEAYLRLMGWYLSDGCAEFRNDKVKGVRISQKKGGRLHWRLSRFHGLYEAQASSSLYEYEKTGLDGLPMTEVILSVRDRTLREQLVEDCGSTKSKHIPRWVFSLSRRLMEILFDAMCGGDGCTRTTSKRSKIYYTSLEGLADDVNELALHCGWETSVWGPYENKTRFSREDSVMYHVHVDKCAPQFQRFMRRSNVRREAVKDHRIVCFTVPNGTLITRRNGRVGIHGNSKHALHLTRLLRMGYEILTTGKVNVRRDDAEELLAIRNGVYSYDEVMAMAEELKAKLDKVYEEKTYVVPFSPPKVEMSDFCVNLHEIHWSGEKQERQAT